MSRRRTSACSATDSQSSLRKLLEPLRDTPRASHAALTILRPSVLDGVVKDHARPARAWRSTASQPAPPESRGYSTGDADALTVARWGGAAAARGANADAARRRGATAATRHRDARSGGATARRGVPPRRAIRGAARRARIADALAAGALAPDMMTTRETRASRRGGRGPSAADVRAPSSARGGANAAAEGPENLKPASRWIERNGRGGGCLVVKYPFM